MKGVNVAKYIDHTILKPDAREADIQTLCKEALQYSFGAVCVNPYWVKTAADILKDTDIKVCSVVGFPLGASLTEVKAYETQKALEAGANEIDVVINIDRVKSRDESSIVNELSEIISLCKPKNAIVKVILETGLLKDDEKIFAAETALKVGVDFVKTSTGFFGGATCNDVALLRKIVGDKAGVKASGGIRSLRDLQRMASAGASRIGTSSGVNIMKELLGE